ncbi:MAG: protein kinase [Micropepsaceae bacterium]
MPRTELKPGLRFGPWELLERLGEGGNGTVWKVRGSAGGLGALKVLRNASDEKRNARLADEISAMRSCQDIPGVLPLLDAHSPARPSHSDPAWFVSALAVSNSKLGDRPLALKDTVIAVNSLARTLAEMHSRGYSHRDIKPDNILEYGGRWCLCDFGLANFPEKVVQTAEGEKLGPMFYIAPEMLNEAAKSDGTKADVYSMGKLLWKLATGQKYPLPGTHSRDTQGLTISAAVATSNAEALDGLLEAMTQFSPGRRPSMAQVAQELETWMLPSPAHREEGDLTHRRARMLELTEQFRRGQSQLESQRDHAEAARSRAFKHLAAPMHRIRERITTAQLGEFSLSPPSGGNFEFYRAAKGDTVIGSGSIDRINGYQFCFTLRVNAGEKWSELRGGVNLGVQTDSGDGAEITTAPVLTAAGYFADTHVMARGSWDSNRHLIWSETGEFFLGQPSEAHILSHFGAELERRLATAIDELLDLQAALRVL